MQTFVDEVWAETHYHVKRSRAGYFDNLLPGPSAGEHLVERFRQEPTAVRLVREKDKKGPDSHRLADGSLDLAGIRSDFAEGYTIVIDGVERYVRPVASLARSIEAELNFPIQVNAYITPPGSQGLVPHYDAHDVLILQIQGSKVWHLYGGARVAPHEMQGKKDPVVPIDGLLALADLCLDPGDVLYLPRGRVHAAETTSEPSVHLTVGLHAPSVLMLAIGALHARSFHDDRLSALLPPRHLDDPRVQATVGALLRDAVRTVEDSSSIAAGLDLLADLLVRRGQCPPVGRMSDAAGIGAETWVRKHQPLYSRVKAGAGRVELQFATLSVDAAPDHEAALQFISTSTEPFRVGDLPQLGAPQQIELARSLLVSGFLALARD